MTEERESTLRYRVLRYMPNVIRDEWINIGVLLEEVPNGTSAGTRRAMRLVEDDADMARIRRLHPGADERLLRSLGDEFDARLGAPGPEGAVYLQKLDQSLSNVLQFSPVRGILAENFDAELDRLFRVYVARPPSARSGVAERARTWIRERVETIFRRHRILQKLERGVRVEEFTQPGDPMRFDYAYRYNGTRGYLQMVPLDRHPSQAKVLAYTAEHIRRHGQKAEFSAITDGEPQPENRRHQFMRQLFAEQNIALVPPNRIEQVAEHLQLRLQ